MSFKLSKDVLVNLFERCGFPVPPAAMLFVGIRGCIPIDMTGTAFEKSHDLEFVGVDYMHLRCTFVQWSPEHGLAVFPGSTVPHLNAVREGLRRGGAGVNQLALGYYRDRHSYYKGDHKPGDPDRRHRAFRNDSVLPVWRTGDDADFEGDDRLDTHMVPHDAIHCAWQPNAAAATFSSSGCQVIVGRPQVAARGWTSELGPWKRFVDHAHAVAQPRFNYALFSGREVLAAANGVGTAKSVRFGSSGELAEQVQELLLSHGYDVGLAGADGDFGLGSVAALHQFQKRAFGAAGADLIAGPTTVAALKTPRSAAPGGGSSQFDATAALYGPRGVHMGVGASASSGPSSEALGPGTRFHSLAPGGVFSNNPFDLSQQRSVRTNNPGALNITPWQRRFKGFAGVTQADRARNRTTIYYTPEHGIAAWYHLLAERYEFPAPGGGGKRESLTIAELAPKYAGVRSADDAVAQHYLVGWKKFGGAQLTDRKELRFDDDADMILLARAMFGHELGMASPLKDAQIVEALTLYRAKALPEN